MPAAILRFPKPQGRLRPIAHPQLTHRALQVNLDRIGPDAELGGDRLVAGAVTREKPHYRKLSWRQIDPLVCALWLALAIWGLWFWAVIVRGIMRLVG